MKLIHLTSKYLFSFLLITASSFLYGQMLEKKSIETVNTRIDQIQQNPVVAFAPNQDYLVVWEGAKQDGEGFGIFGQLFNANQKKKGLEFQINASTNLDQKAPTLAFSTSGRFVVAWMSERPSKKGSWEVALQLFNNQGEKSGQEIHLSPYSENLQKFPSITFDQKENIIVAWEEIHEDGDFSIQIQRLSKTGDLIGNPFSISDKNTAYKGYPSVSVNPNGFSIVAWQELNKVSSNHDIKLQKVSPDGLLLSKAITLENDNNGNQLAPKAFYDRFGELTVVWNHYAANANDNSIKMTRFDSQGNQIGKVKNIVSTSNNTTSFDNVSLSTTRNGYHTIGWNQFEQTGILKGIEIGVFDKNGEEIYHSSISNPSEDEFRHLPAIAASPFDNSTVLVWQEGNKAVFDDHNYDKYDIHQQTLFLKSDENDNASFPEPLSPQDKPEVVLTYINVFPNPNPGNFNLTYTGIQTDELDLQITDMNGKLLWQGKLFDLKEHDQRELGGHNFAEGMYYLHVSDPANGFRDTKQVMVIRD